MLDFTSLGITEQTVKTLKENGIAVPTPIQEKAIPIVMNGKDVIAQAQTGTGKTLAFVLPILEKIDTYSEHIQALIVTPTRELALQITEEVEKLISDRAEMNVLAVYGGQDVERQLKKLQKNVQIVVGTPGRLLDHIRRKTINLSKVSFLVLDEADQMLHIGFLDEVENIIKETPASRQTMLFSATMPTEIRKLARKHMKEPQYIQVEKKQGPAETVKQVAIHTIDRAKQATLIQLIETHRPFMAVIFCRTKRRVSKLYEVLKSNRFKCDELHGDLSQSKREQVMKRFREAEVQLLVATDVAARGLDVEGVTHVFNYDIPLDSESYIHRIGRTGRAGMTGMAITLYSSADRPTLDMIEKELNITIPKQNLEKNNDNQNLSKTDIKGTTRHKENRGSKRGKPGKESNSRAREQRSEKEPLQKSSNKTNDRHEKGNTKRPESKENIHITGRSHSKGTRSKDESKLHSSRESRDAKQRNSTRSSNGNQAPGKVVASKSNTRYGRSTRRKTK